ncbi:MAG TPA: chemotaxis protein CheW [Nocardioidaceae bacterium]|nr:chemotaxis protein CheW [Nocardioidaceae bacterium]
MTTELLTATERYCTFWVGDLFFGVDVEQVQEVLRYQEMTVVPQAPESVRGLINLRGQIVTAVDLRCRLGLPAREDDTLPMNVIVRSRGEVVSLLVDDIGDVMEAGDRVPEPVPANLPGAVASALLGVIPLPETILLVLDANRAVERRSQDRSDRRNQ